MAHYKRKGMIGCEKYGESAKLTFPSLYVTTTLCDITKDIGKGTLLLKLASFVN